MRRVSTILVWSTTDPDSLDVKLNELGAQGWKTDTACPGSPGNIFVFVSHEGLPFACPTCGTGRVAFPPGFPETVCCGKGWTIDPNGELVGVEAQTA